MNTKSYTSLLANPSKINSSGQNELDQIIKKYPYFQSARALQLKGFKNVNSYLYNDALKRTAAHTTDRSVLFDFITSEHFAQNEISEVIQQHDESVNQIDVISENVTEEMSRKIDQQIKDELRKAEAILNPELFTRKVESLKKIAGEYRPVPDGLEIDRPLDFTKEDPHSFNEWLKLTKATPIKREFQKPMDLGEKDYQNKLIEKFIQERPKIVIKDKESDKREPVKNENLAAPFTQTPDSLMTETLARVYLQQKNYKKALQAYHILILKYPEKSGFFADQIRMIKKLLNK